MTELITELVRKKTGYYDLTIRTADGTVLLDVRGIPKGAAIRLIDETAQKVDAG